MPHEVLLALIALLGMGVVFLLVTRFQLTAILALAVGSIVVGVCAGVSPLDIVRAFNEGVGGVLSYLAVPLALGVMLGRLLAESGGAKVIAQALVRAVGAKQLPLLLVLLSLLAGVPLILGVGMLLLWPVLFALALELRLPVLRLGLPLAAGFSLAHGLAPPHPGPMFALEMLGAQMGTTLCFGLIISAPLVLVIGFGFGRFIASRVTPELGGLGAQFANPEARPAEPPSLARALGTLLVPVAVMSIGMVVEVVYAELRFLYPQEPGSTAAPATLHAVHHFRVVTGLLSAPLVALTAGLLVACVTLGPRCGFRGGQIRDLLERDFGHVALLLLAMGAGSGFGKVLDYAGMGGLIVEVAFDLPGSPLLVGWLVAALVRATSGSTTAAITMAANVMAPAAPTMMGLERDLLLLSIGAGSLFFSFVNDGAFWFMKEYFNLTVTETLRTWTVMQALLSLGALCLILLLGHFI